MVKNFFLICAAITFGRSAFGQQIVINEVQYSNISTVFDHTGNTPDWIEIYNQAATDINLNNYSLSDKRTLPQKWTFPSTTIKLGEYLLVFASGLDLKKPHLYWETIIDKGATWKYLVPTAEMPGTWAGTAFNDSGWQEGRSGFGYGDNDDSTSIGTTLSVFLRKKFTVTNPANILQAWLHLDYDDGFIAYINGVEIARANIDNALTMPPGNQPAIGNHEALMYQGLPPEAFFVDSVFNYLQPGENVLSVRIFNQSIGSSDLTAIPFLSLGYQDGGGNQMHQSPYFDIPQIGLHTNFKLDSDLDSLYLADATGAIIDSVQVVIPAKYSYGRRLDNLDKWAFYTEPTPSKANTTPAFENTTLGEVNYSIQGGYQKSAIVLALTAENPGDSIFYTLDGTEPGATSQYFFAPIWISKNTVVRARILRKGYLPGPIGSQLYILGVKHDLPIVSISTSPDNLWDEDYGIYVKGKNASAEFPYFGANFWQDWERPANLSMYEPDGSMAFQVDGGIKIYGAYGRGNNQKSLTFHARKAYGDGKIEYKIFNDLDLNEFENLVLRNSGNDFNNTMMRDALCSTIVDEFGLDHMAYRPTAAYVNGEYWGILNIREKINEAFLVSHHGVDRDNIDILEGGGTPIVGTSDHYASMMTFASSNNLALKDNYNYMKQQMDIDNYIKYQVAQIFIDNRDWPGNNIKFWRERTSAGKWRWILFDQDFGFNTWANDNQNFNTLAFALEPNGPGWPNPAWSTLLFRKLMENESFRNDFINCFADNLNTIFDPQILLQTIEKLKSAIDTEMPRHMIRWNGNMNYREERVEAMRQFARARQSVVRQNIRTQFSLTGLYHLNVGVSGQGSVRVNTIQPASFPWSGMYFNGIPISIRAVPAPGYRFVRWEGAQQQHGELLTLTESTNQEIIAYFEPAAVSADNVVINEINYNSSETFNVGDWIELFNTSDRDINISGWRLLDGNENEYVFPTGTIIERGNFLVVCRNRKDFAVGFPEVAVLEKEPDFGFSSGGDCVSLLSTDKKQIDKVCYTNYTPWPLEPNGGGATLSLIDSYTSNDVPGNWQTSQGNGTPGARNNMITGIEDIALTELLLFPNPAKDVVHVNIKSVAGGGLAGHIIDMTGKQSVIADHIQLQPGHNILTFILDNYQSGMYIITLSHGGNTTRSKLVIRPR